VQNLAQYEGAKTREIVARKAGFASAKPPLLPEQKPGTGSLLARTSTATGALGLPMLAVFC